MFEMFEVFEMFEMFEMFELPRDLASSTGLPFQHSVHDIETVGPMERADWRKLWHKKTTLDLDVEIRS